jgi:hypothetical protein
MIVVPVALVVVEVGHPSGSATDVYRRLNPMPEHWLRIHLLQAPLFGLMAVAALNLTWEMKGFWPLLSRVALWFFVVFYTVLDSIVGLAVGTILAHQTPAMDAATTAEIVQRLFNDPIVGGNGSLVSRTGSWAWFVAMIAAIVSLFLVNRGRSLSVLFPPLVLLAICAWAIETSHTNPTGPIAFACFALASIWFEIFRFGPTEVTACVALDQAAPSDTGMLLG